MRRRGDGRSRCDCVVVTGSNGREQDRGQQEAGDGQSRAPAGLHPPEQLNSLFWTSATLRPRRLAGPEHWVKSPMVGLCLSHCESQARWQSQNRWLECRRLQGDRAAHNPPDPSHRVGTPPPRGSEPCCTPPKRSLAAVSPQVQRGDYPRQQGTPSGCPFVPACSPPPPAGFCPVHVDSPP